MSSPLSGVRVLDLTRLVPGAFATLMLAELGADVIKIEDPRGGDPMRHMPPRLDDERGRGLFDLLLNRGKRSVVIDLRLPETAAVLDRLFASADVVVESFRPGTARRLGVSAAQVRARHPRIVHCAITGYGQTGPYAERPGHDLNYVAQAGLLSVDRPGLTSLPHMFIADIGGGAMSAVVGILAALVRRARDGEGDTLDISMHEAALYWLMLPAARALVADGRASAQDLPTFGSHACYNVYAAADGRHLALGALEEKFWRGFCEAAGRPAWIPRHLTGAADQAALLPEVRAAFASRTRAEWLALAAVHDICLTPVNDPDEALADPHITARGAVIDAGRLRAIRPPFLGRSPALTPAPTLGEHTRAVLDAL